MQKTSPEPAPWSLNPTLSTTMNAPPASGTVRGLGARWRELRATRARLGLDAGTTALLLLVGAGLIYEDAFRRGTSHGVFWIGLCLMGVGVLCRRPAGAGPLVEPHRALAPGRSRAVERVFDGEA